MIRPNGTAASGLACFETEKGIGTLASFPRNVFVKTPLGDPHGDRLQ